MGRFFGEDAFDRILLGRAGFVIDVFLRFLEEHQVADQAIILWHHNTQFVVIDGIGLVLIKGIAMVVERGNNVDCQFMFTAYLHVIQLAGERIVLPTLIPADLTVLDHTVKHQLLQFGGDGLGINLSVLDLRLDVLLFIREVFVELTVTLNKRLIFE